MLRLKANLCSTTEVERILRTSTYLARTHNQLCAVQQSKQCQISRRTSTRPLTGSWRRPRVCCAKMYERCCKSGMNMIQIFDGYGTRFMCFCVKLGGLAIYHRDDYCCVLSWQLSRGTEDWTSRAFTQQAAEIWKALDFACSTLGGAKKVLGW